MHIAEGILSLPVLASGGALAAAGMAMGLKKMNTDRVPKTGMLAAAFFVASLIHVPLGPSNVHLILNGIVGLLLGWSAFPAIFVALVLQAFFFQYGGITTLGVNTVLMALPAVVCSYAFYPLLGRSRSAAMAGAFGCGMLSVLLSGLLMAGFLIFTGEHFTEVSVLVIGAHVPVMVIEGLITMFCIGFLKKVQPSLIYK
ncbi:MAG: cobalt transporter CbiM [Thermodesulfobacteriota bacterium]